MAYFLLVSSIPNVFFQLYHLAKEFRSPTFKRFFFFKPSTTAIFVFNFNNQIRLPIHKVFLTVSKIEKYCPFILVGVLLKKPLGDE